MPHPSRAGPLVGCFHLEGVPWHHLSPPPHRPVQCQLLTDASLRTSLKQPPSFVHSLSPFKALATSGKYSLVYI